MIWPGFAAPLIFEWFSQFVARRPALDGLRGVAAFVVLLCHCLLTWPGWANAWLGTRGTWVAYTPIHVLVDGTLAVYVFFVLSGFVLVRQLDQGLGRYYPARLLRLYLPVWGAVAFAVLCAAVVQRTNSGSWWVAVHAGSLNSRSALDEASLWQNTWLNSVLWSLRWEVVFSLALPAYVLAARRTRSLPLPVNAAALLLLSGLGVYLHHESMQYLPVFGLGVLMTLRADELPDFTSPRQVREIAGLALCAASFMWLLARSPWAGRGVAAAGVTLLQIAAAAAIVLLAVKAPSVERGLSRRMPRWLGSRSFALYLVHEPIVVSVALLTHHTALTLVIAVPLSLVVAEAFFRVVERPSHRLSRAAGTVRLRRLKVAAVS